MSSRAASSADISRRTVGLTFNVASLLLAAEFSTVDAGVASLLLMLSLFGTGLVTYDGRSGPAGAGTLFVGVFGLFHVGLMVAYTIWGSEVLVGQGDNSWVVGGALRPATLSTVVGFLGISVGYCLIPTREWRGSVRPGKRRLDENRLRMVGWTTLAVGLGIMTPVILRAGIGSGYQALRDAASGGFYGYGTLFFGYGALFLVHAEGAVKKYAMTILIGVGTVLLIMGTRGTVIFTALAVIFVLGRSRRITWGGAMLGSVFVLGLISVLRQTRTNGITGILKGNWDIAPAQGLAEMGYSLYPVVVVQEWMEQGTTPRWGLTLVAVPLRIAESLLGQTLPAPDMRLFNVEIQERVGPIGGSPVAEGVRNGGNLFVFLLLCAVGVLLAYIQQRHTRLGVLAGGVLLLPLLVFSRNTFGPLPLQWVIGLGLVYLASRALREDPPRAVK